MAYLNGVFFSKELSRPVHYTAVLCNDNASGTDGNPCYDRPVKNIYLLHGYSGCETDWFTNAPLGDLANRYNVNFFMPNGDNSFYLNQPQTGCHYQNYVGKEFVEYTRRTFALSTDREDTFIGGYSMGGFGALHTALSYPETFGKVIALSSALIVGGLKYMSPEDNNPMANYAYYSWVFGDLKNAENTDANPEVLIRKLQANGTKLPELYIACGTEDFLIQPNRALKAFLDEQNVPVTYVEGPGVHNFDFWRAYLEKALSCFFEAKID